ncbi:hypothetical protein MNBD_BACTEROID07-1463 [hydrothermal vent metagenome]|uniref:Uncharacterized protein n=1 Tax=hydrothermal vent metagenome TaxID=652676 RepID=A0A3B0UBY3_9ZZZZ
MINQVDYKGVVFVLEVEKVVFCGNHEERKALFRFLIR